jgi:hypothetical protein
MPTNHGGFAVRADQIREWATATRRLISLTAAFGIASVVLAFVTTMMLTTSAGRPFWSVQAGLFGWVALGVVLAQFLQSLGWLWQTVRMSAEYGSPSGGHLGIWMWAVFLVLLVAGFLAGLLPGSTVVALWVQAGLRLAGSIALILGLRHTRAWFRERATPGAAPADLVSGADPFRPAAPIPTSDDWNASAWDPEVHREIERRRGRGGLS